MLAVCIVAYALKQKKNRGKFFIFFQIDNQKHFTNAYINLTERFCDFGILHYVTTRDINGCPRFVYFRINHVKFSNHNYAMSVTCLGK